jgi:crossover junction endodeoxyribonuclease RusA
MRDETRAPLDFFEFVIEGPPVSVKAKKTNTRRYRKWISTLRSAARKEWPDNEPPIVDPSITVHITNYFTLAPPDVDNIIKPILDALETVVYTKDEQVWKVISQKVDLSLMPTIQDPSPLLAGALEKYSELLHIVVTWKAED